MASTSGELEVKYFSFDNFQFQDGTTVPKVKLAYSDINPTSTKVALIVTCFKGKINTTLNFSDSALRDHRVIVVALFGNGESSSPSNTPGFPALLDYRDCVRAQHQLLTQGLKINSVDLVMGFSMGGQTTYHWAAMYPDFMQNAVVNCSSARTSGHNYQFLEGPKAALENAIDYAGVEQLQDRKSPQGIKAFGKAYSAWLTSAEWFDEKCYTELGFETLEEWDKQTCEVGYEGWHPDDLLSKLRMWQNGDVTRCIEGANSVEKALGQIQARVLLMPCKTDQYFRWEVSEREAKHLKKAELAVIPSIWGHIAGGGACSQDTKWMDEKISSFLSGSK